MRLKILIFIFVALALFNPAVESSPGFNNNSEPMLFSQLVVNVRSVSLNRTSATLRVGQSTTLTATITPQNATNQDVRWTSSNPGVASVNPTGPLTASVNALSGGSTLITVTTDDGNRIATCLISVTIPVRSISLDQTRITLAPNEEVILNAKVVPSDATNQALTWSSTTAGVASVVPVNPALTAAPNPQARVTAHKEGETRIIVRSVDDNSISTFCTVVVSSSAPAAETESPPPPPVEEQPQEITATGDSETVVSSSDISVYPFIIIGALVLLAVPVILMLSRSKTQTAVSPASLAGLSGYFAGRNVNFAGGQLVIGRDAAAQVVYPESNGQISRRHCTVTYDQSTHSFVLVDSSTNGTFLAGGEKLVSGRPYLLKPGDRFYLAAPGEMFELRLG